MREKTHWKKGTERRGNKGAARVGEAERKFVCVCPIVQLNLYFVRNFGIIWMGDGVERTGGEKDRWMVR